jgi:hypothetical protein
MSIATALGFLDLNLDVSMLSSSIVSIVIPTNSVWWNLCSKFLGIEWAI